MKVSFKWGLWITFLEPPLPSKGEGVGGVGWGGALGERKGY